MQAPPVSPASVRNSGPIAEVLKYELAGREQVLEIGSGYGQHAVTMGRALPNIRWQTSDLPESHDSIRSQIAYSGLTNVLAPQLLDMRAPPPPVHRFDGVFSANTMHIMEQAAVDNMLPFVASALLPGGCFCYYGPFLRDGQFTSDSNQAFDRSLRANDASMGLRELALVSKLANEAGLTLTRTYAMPANNLLLVWRRADTVS